MIIFIGTK